MYYGRRCQINNNIFADIEKEKGLNMFKIEKRYLLDVRGSYKSIKFHKWILWSPNFPNLESPVQGEGNLVHSFIIWEVQLRKSIAIHIFFLDAIYIGTFILPLFSFVFGADRSSRAR